MKKEGPDETVDVAESRAMGSTYGVPHIFGPHIGPHTVWGPNMCANAYMCVLRCVVELRPLGFRVQTLETFRV
jgi:hypothetical protein